MGLLDLHFEVITASRDLVDDLLHAVNCVLLQSVEAIDRFVLTRDLAQDADQSVSQFIAILIRKSGLLLLLEGDECCSLLLAASFLLPSHSCLLQFLHLLLEVSIVEAKILDFVL